MPYWNGRSHSTSNVLEEREHTSADAHGYQMVNNLQKCRLIKRLEDPDDTEGDGEASSAQGAQAGRILHSEIPFEVFLHTKEPCAFAL